MRKIQEFVVSSNNPNQELPHSTDFIPLAVPDLRGNELKYLAQCVEDNWVSSVGPYVSDLEEKVATLSECDFGVAMVNGTAALQLALTCAGVKPGDHVIVPDWTFAATANAVCHAGATPYFVDIDPDTWTLSPNLVEKALAVDRDTSKKISAVLAVHVLGHPAEMDRLRQICQAAAVTLLEDAAGAVGGQYKAKPVGGLARAGIFSFNGNKTVTAGGGGMVVTNDAVLAQRAKHLSAQARPGTDYIHDEVGYNYRMTNINAAVGLAQLERLEEMVAAKRRIAASYNNAFMALDNIQPMPEAQWATSSCWLYSVRVPSAKDAASLVQTCGQMNVGARSFWRTLSWQKPYATSPNLLNGVAGRLSGCVVSLPCSSSLNEYDQIRVIETVRNWHRERWS